MLIWLIIIRSVFVLYIYIYICMYYTCRMKQNKNICGQIGNSQIIEAKCRFFLKKRNQNTKVWILLYYIGLAGWLVIINSNCLFNNLFAYIYIYIRGGQAPW